MNRADKKTDQLDKKRKTYPPAFNPRLSITDYPQPMKEFDFNSYQFNKRSEGVKNLLLHAYKSHMSHSEFIDEYIKVSTNKWSAGSSKRLHLAFKEYEHLDEKFNFFGNYEE